MSSDPRSITCEDVMNRCGELNKQYGDSAQYETTVKLLMAEKRIEELNRLAIYLYNSGYHAGHEDTVEGGYTDVYPCDMHTYHDDIVAELIQEQSE